MGKGLGKALSDSYPLTYNLGMFPLTIDSFVFIHIVFQYGTDLLIVTIYKHNNDDEDIHNQ